MLRLISDPNKIEQVLYADCPTQSIGIRMKMRALYRAYGLNHPFCSYYISEDEKAAAVLYEGSLLFSDICFRSLYWEDSLSLLPVQNISSDTVLDLTGFGCKSGTFFRHENQETAESFPLSHGEIAEGYRILKQVFPETFCFDEKQKEQDFYMQWYCDMSHRIRHGVTDLTILENRATATVFCVEEQAVFLSQIGVLPGLRGGGFGRKLISSVMAAYSGKTCYVFSKNPNADKFYLALGFTPVGSWQDYFRKDQENDS